MTMATHHITTGQVRCIWSLARQRLGWESDELHQWLADRGFAGTSVTELTLTQAINVIDMLKALSEGRSPRVWHVDQATVRQQVEIERLTVDAGLVAQLPGVVSRVTAGRVDSPAACAIWEARKVIEALKSMARRRRTT
jgi:hypothetical protein